MDEETKTPLRHNAGWRSWPKKCIQVLALLLSYVGRGCKKLFAPVRRLVKKVFTAPRKVRQMNRDRQENRFPEAENAIVRLLLFFRGNLPHLGAMLQERVLRRRKRSAQGSGRVRSRMEALQMPPLAFLGGALVIALAAAGISFYTVGTAVSYDGTDLGVVSGRKAVRQAVAELEDTTRQTLDRSDYAVNDQLLTSRLKLTLRREVEDGEVLRDKLMDKVGLIDYGYVLYVNEEPVAATGFAGALEQLLEQMKMGYVTADTVSCEFAEQVEVRREYVDRQYMMNLGYIAQRLNATRTAEITHTVTADDTWEGIAAAYNLTAESLLEKNPGYNISELREGDVLTVAQAQSYLTVVDVERQASVQDVPYEITYQDDPDMYQGDYEIISPGAFGKADVTANVTYVNGTESSRQTVASTVLIAPVTEVQRRGTLERPSWLPTGEFHWPCYGTITSYFGYRSVDTPGATSYHEALDIANGYGTPIYASDGGTVTYSGWQGGTGYTVVIDHGNGFQTLYGHNNSLAVDAGDHVYQGQLIAYMGSTGISSGPHCHFSIIRNGTYVDPLNYLS